MGTSYGRLRRFPIAWGYLPEALPLGETGGTGLMLGTCLVGPVLLAWFLDVATLLLSMLVFCPCGERRASLIGCPFFFSPSSALSF